MIRYVFGALALAAGLALTAPSRVEAQSLTVPPDLRGPSEAAPAPSESTKTRGSRKTKQKSSAAQGRSQERSLNVPGGSGSRASATPQERRQYPADIDRNAPENQPRVSPSFTPGKGLGLGGRF